MGAGCVGANAIGVDASPTAAIARTVAVAAAAAADGYAARIGAGAGKMGKQGDKASAKSQLAVARGSASRIEGGKAVVEAVRVSDSTVGWGALSMAVVEAEDGEGTHLSHLMGC